MSDDEAAPSPLTVQQAQIWALARGIDRIDSQWLLCRVMSCGRSDLVTRGNECLEVSDAAAFANGVGRLARGEPLAYVLGDAVFRGLHLSVNPSVLVPRSDTETLVDWGIEILTKNGLWPSPLVLDLGTGSGAIALAMKQTCPHAHVTATDFSSAALETARGNAARLGFEIRWAQGDWWHAVLPQRFHLVLSNPPYIADDDAHLLALTHEPRKSLVSAHGGLADLLAIIDAAPDGLHDGGWLALEHGHDQAVAVAQRLVERGFVDVRSRRDLAGRWRCTGGRWIAARDGRDRLPSR
jgi:release factor glutamine methyltransferase